MRAAALALGFIVLCGGPAMAQTETRYFTSIDGLMDGNADIILKEVRSGRAVTSAVLDICYPASPGSSRNDRFVVNLAASGQSLTGTTTTLGDKLPVTVKLTRKMVDGRYDFAGQITVGQTTTQVESTDNADMSEAEFKETRGTDSEIASAPQSFAEVSPEAIAVRVRLDSMVSFLTALKGQDVEVDYASLVTSCDELRAGEQVLTMSVDPERAGEFLARFKTMPGVTASGWTSGSFDMERTIRFADAPWREGGKINRERIAKTITDALTKPLDAQAVHASWDSALGRLTVTFKRPSTAMAGLGLTETLSANVIVAPERPTNPDHLLLWLDQFSSSTADETAGGKLRLADSSSGDEEGSPVNDNDSVVALANAFKAQRWDAERGAWK